jgi:hypothetical protein
VFRADGFAGLGCHSSAIIQVTLTTGNNTQAGETEFALSDKDRRALMLGEWLATPESDHFEFEI